MKNKIFSIKEHGLYYKIKIFGMSFNIKSLKLAYKEIKRLKQKMITSRSAEFFFAAEDKFSEREKIWYLSQEFYEVVGYYPNLTNPRTFNEKLNWMKLHYEHPLQKICIDKYLVKTYVDKKLGEGYIIPLLGAYSDVNEIDFNSLPDRFVIKTTFDGGGLGVWVIKNKNKMNIDKLKYEINNQMQKWHSLYYRFMSRGYKEIEPKIIIEEYMENKNGQLNDYKFMCFHGEPKLILAICDRKNDAYNITYYDTDWKKLNLKYKNYKNKDVEKPKNIDKMLEIAKKLSAPFPFVRIDLYNVDGKIYVGELSFTPVSGFSKFNPIEWDYKLGEWLDLSKIPQEHLNILPEFAEGAKNFINPQFIENKAE